MRNFSLFVLSIFMLLSCNDEPKKEFDNNPEIEENINDLFAKEDKSIELSGAPAENLLSILESLSFDKVLKLGETSISESDYIQIKDFTDELIKKSAAKNEKDKHDAIFNWIKKMVKYGYNLDNSIPDYNSAFSTFKYCEAVCQGYSNLLKVMCHTQGINAPVVNGLAKFSGALGNPFGHAWNYVLLDGKWYVSDATNKILYSANDKNKFNFLLPERIDFTLWQDDIGVYTYENREITLSNFSEKLNDTKISIPYSISGFRVTNFNPEKIPAMVKDIYISSNVKDFGIQGNRKIYESGKNLENIYISDSNPYLENYKGIVYKKGNYHEVLIIPNKLKRIEPKLVKIISKNMIYRHDGVEEIYIPEGVEKIEDHAIEYCPNLKTIYIHKGTKISEKIFAECHPDCKIVWY